MTRCLNVNNAVPKVNKLLAVQPVVDILTWNKRKFRLKNIISGYTTVFDVNSAGTLQKGLQSGSALVGPALVIHRLKLHVASMWAFDVTIYLQSSQIFG